MTAGAQRHRPGGAAAGAQRPAGGEGEPGDPFPGAATGALVERRGHPHHVCHLEQEGGDQVGVPGARLQGPQAPVEQQEGPGRALPFLGDGVHHLHHRPRGQDPLQVAPQVGEGLDDRHLGDGVQPPALVEHQVHLAEGLQAPAEAAGGLAHPLGHGPHLAVVGAEQHHHPVGLPEGVGPQHDALVVAERHRGQRTGWRAVAPGPAAPGSRNPARLARRQSDSEPRKSHAPPSPPAGRPRGSAARRPRRGRRSDRPSRADPALALRQMPPPRTRTW